MHSAPLRHASQIAAQELDLYGDRSAVKTGKPGMPTSLIAITGPMDTNNDNVLSHDEFMAALAVSRAAPAP